MSEQAFPYAELVIDDTAGDSVTIEVRTSGVVPLHIRGQIVALHRYAQKIVQEGETRLGDPQGDTAVVTLRIEHTGATDKISLDFGPEGISSIEGTPTSISKQVLGLLFESLTEIGLTQWEVGNE